jgi:hypothetical protein
MVLRETDFFNQRAGTAPATGAAGRNSGVPSHQSMVFL